MNDTKSANASQPPVARRPAAVLVLATLAAAGLSGCLDFDLDQGASVNSITLKPVTDHDGAFGLEGVRIEEADEGLVVTFLLEAPNGNEADRLSCQVRGNGPVEHLLSMRNSSLGMTDSGVVYAETLSRGPDHFSYREPYALMAALTWAESFDVFCTGRPDGQHRVFTETATFVWQTQRRMGDPDNANGVGPFFFRERVFSDPCCDATSGNQTATVDFPPNDIVSVSMWQDAEGLVLETTTADRPLETAKLDWGFRPTEEPGQVLVQSQSFEYIFANDTAWGPGGEQLEATREGNVVTLQVPWPLVEDRKHEEYIQWSANLVSHENGTAYLEAVVPPPYWFQ